MLPAIPFWNILMAFTFAGLLTIKLPPALKMLLLGASAAILLSGLIPSVQYIYGKTTNPFSIGSFAQGRLAVSRFLRNVVAGKEHPDPPCLEHDEFNRVQGIPDPPYEALICARDANVVLHLFLHDYDDGRILSFCGGTPFAVMTQQAVWSHNKQAILDYVPKGKDLKLIWESDPKTRRIIAMFRLLSDLATADSVWFSFGGRVRAFYVLNIPYKDIRQFQERVRALPDLAF
jgi:hypothetical protein